MSYKCSITSYIKRSIMMLTLGLYATIESKYIKLFNKEKVVIFLPKDDITAQKIQDQIDLSLHNQELDIIKAKKANKHVAHITFEQDTIETQIATNVITDTKVHINTVVHNSENNSTVLPQPVTIYQDMYISDLFDIFATTNNTDFFHTYGPTISYFLCKKHKSKNNEQKLSAIVTYWIYLEYPQSHNKDNDLFIQNICGQDTVLFPYIAFKKLLKKQIKAIKYNKYVLEMNTKQEIAHIQKKMQDVLNHINQHPTYVYEQQIKGTQSNFSTKQMPYRYNQLPYIDRDFIKHCNTDSGIPQCKTHYELKYA